MRQTLFIHTADHVEIAADHYPPAQNSSRGVLFLHMMPATRRSYRAFAEKIQQRGFHALAIDFRGHGDSLKTIDGKALDYRIFSDAEHQQSIQDARAGIEFLRQKGATDIFLVGASIGANIALQALVEDSALKGSVLLSAGYDYRGIETTALVPRLHAGQRVLFFGSNDDMRGSGHSAADMAYGLAKRVAEGVETKVTVFESAGHGTDMIEKQPECAEEIIAWLEKRNSHNS